MAIQQVTDFRQGLKEAIDKADKITLPVLFSHVEAISNTGPLELYKLSEKLYKGERFYWKNPEKDLIFTGMGIAHRMQSSTDGKRRFQTLQQKWDTITANTIIKGILHQAGTGPIAFGGFSFNDRDIQPNTLWDQFGTYLFYIPKFLITQTPEALFLTSTILIEKDMSAKILESFVTEREHIRNLRGNGISEIPEIISYQEQSVYEWKQSIQKSVEDIHNHEMDKIVLARQLDLTFASELSSNGVLENLLCMQNDSFVFSLESGDNNFVGASPERLVKRIGNQVFSSCIAGSIARGENEQKDKELGSELLNDDKNLIEHQFVVNMIRKAMEEQCSRVDIPSCPQLMKLKNIQHLYTPVEGTSLPGTSILDFVERLHPTPALGGSPRNVAMEKIPEYESFDRGLYAAPIGWIDMNGDGDFAVGIRSALLKKTQASLFAGCGIVAKSDPESEYQETSVKFKPMLTAFGGIKK